MAEDGDLYQEGLPPRWWAIKPEQRETYERNQGEFEKQFGDFASVRIIGYGVAASPDGRLIGFEFHLEDGTRFRGAMPSVDVHLDLAAMIMLALERCVVRSMPIDDVKAN